MGIRTSLNYDKGRFSAAATNLHTQDFFTKYLLKDLPNSNQPILTTSLFLHVAEKFKENTSFCRQILEVAIERIDQEDDRQCQLWNKVFTLRLQDEDYTGAYRAMISNTDIDSQKNCLRTFVLHLSDSGDFGPLVNSEYSGLESEIAPILENRALAVSPEDTRYFDLLYAFMSVRENYRGAARAMYLQSQHIASGYESLEQLETRESALLTAINSLYLVKKEDQWVATASANGVPLPVKSPKRTHEGGMRVPLSKDTVVTSLEDMENECLLVQARLALKMDDIDTAGLDASEIATLMAKRGMYHEAGNLLKSFKEPADVPVKILASTYACNISRPEAEGLEMQLIDLMEEFEAGANSTRLYYIASEEILKIGQMIPSIMLENYREREPTELIRQMAKYGELDEAVDGACFILEKAQTLLERKKSLDNFWLPSMLIEQLNTFTKIHNHELHELLQTRMDRFLQILENSVRQNVAN
ncbi:unnamed protein product [Oikopleura dioica]|uniref:NUP160 middle TPR domain-containing protein n=1 Tax=Oikopleura dioica TaxID=34765 RepID=E4WWX2_OIKDI|nr:unnamed protein product [Oikopleura dioica]